MLVLFEINSMEVTRKRGIGRLVREARKCAFEIDRYRAAPLPWLTSRDWERPGVFGEANRGLVDTSNRRAVWKWPGRHLPWAYPPQRCRMEMFGDGSLFVECHSHRGDVDLDNLVCQMLLVIRYHHRLMKAVDLPEKEFGYNLIFRGEGLRAEVEFTSRFLKRAMIDTNGPDVQCPVRWGKFSAWGMHWTNLNLPPLTGLLDAFKHALIHHTSGFVYSGRERTRVKLTPEQAVQATKHLSTALHEIELDLVLS